MNKQVDSSDQNPNDKAVINFCETNFKNDWGLNIYSDNDVDTYIVITVPSKLYGKQNSLITAGSTDSLQTIVEQIKDRY